LASESERGRLGLWLVGARGAISTCVAYGLFGLRQGLVEPTGITTERGPLGRLGLRPFEDVVLGGHEIGAGRLTQTAGELVRNGVLDRDLVAAASAEAAAYEARIRPGILDGMDVGDGDLDPASAGLGGVDAAAQVERVQADLEAFRDEHELERVVVCYVASTEAWREEAPEWASLEAFERALESSTSLPASSLYACAALRANAPFVNFTPNRGASLPALEELALQRGVPHCGNDGKTGETLVKTVLAPLFAARALKVHAWQGYNMLGNRDGQVLSDPVRKESKRRNKASVLESILGPVHGDVRIDYVPSLHDWKTAWDFVHFEGFLGAKMSLQFTWTGSDSALAAPLVIDLARLADFAHARGEAGAMEHTACFFKAPLARSTGSGQDPVASAGGGHDFHDQFRRLLDYAERHLAND